MQYLVSCGSHKQEGWCLQDDLIAAPEDWKQHWPHKAKSKTRYSQNAFHRGQYANFSTTANDSSGGLFQIKVGVVGGSRVGLRGEDMSGPSCSRQE